VTQNGIVIMGLAALVILLWSRGSVDLLVVLYSINVFLTFSLSLLGLCIYLVSALHGDRYPSCSSSLGLAKSDPGWSAALEAALTTAEGAGDLSALREQLVLMLT
jgi:hypothetical protein